MITLKELELLIEIMALHRRKLRNRLDQMVIPSSIFHYEQQLKQTQLIIEKLGELRQELMTIRLPRWRYDNIGKIYDPDL